MRARLARAGRADQRDGLARIDPEADVLQHRLARPVAEGDVPELDRAVHVARQRDGAGLVLDVDRHVEHLGDALARRHGALHHAVLHGRASGSDRRSAGCRTGTPPSRRCRGCGPAPSSRRRRSTVAMAMPVSVSTIGTMTCAYFADGQVRLEVGAAPSRRRASKLTCWRSRLCTVRTPWMPSASAPLAIELVSCAAMKATLGARQPEQAHDEQHRHGRQRQQAEPESSHSSTPTMPNSSTMSPTDITERLEELLHRVDVALQARHQPADLGLVHEAQRHPLQVREHGAAHVEQHVLGHLADDAFLHIAGGVVDEDRHREGARPPRPAPTRSSRPAPCRGRWRSG